MSCRATRGVDSNRAVWFIRIQKKEDKRENKKEQKKKRESEKRKQLKEAAENLEKKSGIKRKENETPYNYNFRVLNEYKPNVTAQDYTTALRRQGMLTGVTQSTLGAEQEEQTY